jgi:hypothetical protein
MKKFLLILILFVSFTRSYSQDPFINKDSEDAFTGIDLRDSPVTLSPSRLNVGLGAGIDYGGFGGRLTILTSEKLEFFGAVGYNTLGAGFNGGIEYRLKPQSYVCPFFGAMYGYNSVIKVPGGEMYNDVYYGPSWNMGLELWSRKQAGFFNIEIIIPIRSHEFWSDVKKMKNNPDLVMDGAILPVSIGVGYHFAL